MKNYNDLCMNAKDPDKPVHPHTLDNIISSV